MTEPRIGDVKEAAKENNFFRKEVFTGAKSRLVIVSLLPDEEIGTETHDGDQLLYAVKGQGIAVIDGTREPFENGAIIGIPAGAAHNVGNTVKDPLRLFTVSAPPQHAAGTIHATNDSATVLTEDDCLALLRSRDLGRIAFDLEDRVEIFPVNYGIEGKIIVFRTSPGTKLAAVGKTAVAFEVDSWDPESGIGWSVVAKGRAEEITTSPGRVAEHLRWVPVHPAAPGDRGHWIGIKPSEITRRRFHVSPAGPRRPSAFGRP